MAILSFRCKTIQTIFQKTTTLKAKCFCKRVFFSEKARGFGKTRKYILACQICHFSAKMFYFTTTLGTKRFSQFIFFLKIPRFLCIHFLAQFYQFGAKRQNWSFSQKKTLDTGRFCMEIYFKPRFLKTTKNHFLSQFY